MLGEVIRMLTASDIAVSITPLRYSPKRKLSAEVAHHAARSMQQALLQG